VVSYVLNLAVLMASRASEPDSGDDLPAD
jgi:hypothetical protein